tara:strand:+ start:896 stop:1438 length:543 start_codon:yes stop_codon:yes gene_type:complete
MGTPHSCLQSTLNIVCHYFDLYGIKLCRAGIAWRTVHIYRNGAKSDMSDIDDTDVLKMATGIISAFVANNAVPAADLPDLIKTVHATIIDLSKADTPKAETPEPAVSIAKSITPDHLVCLEDGRKLKMLKRYLRSRYDMTPEEYRARWNLPADYPMVAPNYAKLRSQHAKDIGLGKKKSS